MDRARRRLLAFGAAAAAGFGVAGAAQAARPKVYAVIFEITVDAEGKLASVTVSKVIDPRTGSTDAVKVQVPDSYVEAMRAKLAAQTFDPAKPRFYMFRYYDPRMPGNIDAPPL